MTEQRYFHDLFGGEAEPGSVAECAILLTDPLLVEPFSVRLDRPVLVADHYEFRVFTGETSGTRVTLCSTGIGGGSTAIAVDNLARLGTQTLLMIDVGLDDSTDNSTKYWCATGAVRQDGASLDYARPEFPAAADPEAQLALFAAARELGHSLRPAILWASVLPLGDEALEAVRHYNRSLVASRAPYGVPLTRSNPEIATLLTLGTLYRRRVGGLFASIAHPADERATLDTLFEIAIQAVRNLKHWEAFKAERGIQMMIPDGVRR